MARLSRRGAPGLQPVRRSLAWILVVAALAALAACTSSDSGSTGSTGSTEQLVPRDASRPFTLFTPSSYEAGSPMPLVLLLHGLASSGDAMEEYFHLQPLAESKGFLYVHPDGTKHANGEQFWNATDGCCGFGSTVDDVAYLTSVIDEVEATRNVDRSRVYVMGHSNGGFMSYRMACDVADRVAAIASVAGATWLDPSKCRPSEPVSVLQVHGTADQGIKYNGGQYPGASVPYPGARTTIATWATYDGCDGELGKPGEPFDLDASVPGNESTAASVDGCPDGIGVELWTVQGGDHIPRVQLPDGATRMPERIVDWLLAHPKPQGRSPGRSSTTGGGA